MLGQQSELERMKKSGAWYQWQYLRDIRRSECESVAWKFAPTRESKVHLHYASRIVLSA